MDSAHEGALLQVSTSDRLNGIGTASLLFDSSRCPVMGAGFFFMLSRASLHLGYKDAVREVFSGNVVRFRVLIREAQSPQMEVVIHNVLSLLHHGRKRKGYTDQSASAIIRGLIKGYHLHAQVAQFGEVQELSIQAGMTDYAYLQFLADRYGKAVYAFGDTVYVGDRITVSQGDVVFELVPSHL
jgi:uncharacterized protein involved in type VI secretion and phage assembly